VIEFGFESSSKVFFGQEKSGGNVSKVVAALLTSTRGVESPCLAFDFFSRSAFCASNCCRCGLLGASSDFQATIRMILWLWHRIIDIGSRRAIQVRVSHKILLDMFIFLFLLEVFL
jgi:hypothetical protein